MKKSTRGGQRPGAGRPKSPYIERNIKIRCTSEEYQRIIEQTTPRERVKIIKEKIMNNKVQPHNIFKASEVNSYAKGWIVDLSGPGIVDPDCYWRFRTRKDAREFARLVNEGENPEYAENLVKGEVPVKSAQ